MMQEVRTVQKIGEIVQRTRKQQALTQLALAAASGVGIRFIRDLEQGKTTIQCGKVLSVLAMLGIEVQLSGAALAQDNE